MYSSNLLITNFCNQNCDFCFANLEMSDEQINREISLEHFKQLLLRLKKSTANTDTIKLLGGEPTLHSQFENIVRLSLKYFPYVQIFTNGIFSEEKARFLKQFFPKVKFTFNLLTPGFLSNKKIHELVLNHIKEFSPITEVSVSLTINPNTDIKSLLSLVNDEIIKQVNIFRIGLANPIAGKKNWYQFKDFSKIGKKLYTLIKYIKILNSETKLFLNCGFTRCMFTNDQYRYLRKSKVRVTRWGCFGKTSSMDITTDLTAFHCLPLSTQHRVPLQSNSLSKTSKQFILKRYEYWEKFRLKTCQKCGLHGHTPNKCPGPCIAFRINEGKER